MIAFLLLIVGLIRRDSNNVAPVEEIGVLMPFSQDFAWWGEAIQDSIELAHKDGYLKNSRFIYRDTKCNTKDAVSAIQSLKAVYPKMHIFIVGCDNDLKAMYRFLDRGKDLTFMVGLSEKTLYDDFPTINLAYRLESEATAAAKFASEKLGVKTLGIIVSSTDFGRTLANTALSYFESIGGKTMGEELKYNEKNPETSVLKILGSKPDAVYLHNDIPGISAILKRLDQLGYKGHRIVYYGGRDQSLIETAGKAAEGVYVPWVVPGTPNPKRFKFEQDFKNIYGKEPFVTAYFVYDGLMLLDEAKASCGPNMACIRDYYYNKDNFEGTLGRVKYQPNGEVERSFHFEQIKDGRFVPVKSNDSNFRP